MTQKPPPPNKTKQKKQNIRKHAVRIIEINYTKRKTLQSHEKMFCYLVATMLKVFLVVY